MIIFLLIIIFSLLINLLLKKSYIPGFIVVIFIGFFSSSYLINDSFFSIDNYSGYICITALVIIFLRASLQIQLSLTSKSNLIIYLLAIIPGFLEAICTAILSYFITPLNFLEALMLGFIMTAVSPAVIVPMMIDLQKRKIGTNKKIPSIILAAASLDDIISILMFSILLTIYETSYIDNYSIAINTFLLLILFILFRFFRRKYKNFINNFSKILSFMWLFASVLLFIFIGSQIDLNIAKQSGFIGCIIIFLGIFIRSISILICLIKTPLLFREKLFIMVSLWPKATVQAALGAIPLMLMINLGQNTTSGYWILSLSTLSIIITAPLGAFMISWSSKKWLTKN